jgi:hypothetical protein
MMAFISKPIGQWTFEDAGGTLGAWWRNPGVPGNPVEKHLPRIMLSYN